MTKNELVKELARVSGATQQQADMIVKDMLALIIKTVMDDGESVTLHGFGAFVQKVRPERKGRNPATGESLILPKSKSLVFKATTNLRNVG